MITSIQVNLGQLNQEALSLDQGHYACVIHGTTPTKDGIYPPGATLMCYDVDNNIIDPCPALLTALASHIAKPTVIPDPLAPQKQALETAVAADVAAGKMSIETALALQDLLNAMAPH